MDGRDGRRVRALRTESYCIVHEKDVRTDSQYIDWIAVALLFLPTAVPITLRRQMMLSLIVYWSQNVSSCYYLASPMPLIWRQIPSCWPIPAKLSVNRFDKFDMNSHHAISDVKVVSTYMMPLAASRKSGPHFLLKELSAIVELGTTWVDLRASSEMLTPRESAISWKLSRILTLKFL